MGPPVGGSIAATIDRRMKGRPRRRAGTGSHQAAFAAPPSCTQPRDAEVKERRTTKSDVLRPSGRASPGQDNGRAGAPLALGASAGG